MNTITKAFIVINMVLALGFAFVVITTYAHSENWKRRWHKDTSALAENLKVAQDANLKFSYDAQSAKQALESTQSQLSDSVRENQTLQTQLTQKDTELASAKQEIDAKNNTINAHNQEISTLRSSLEIARKRMSELNHIAQVSRAVAFQLSVKLAEVEDDLNHSNTQLTRTEEVVYQLEEEGKRQDAHLAVLRRDHPEIHGRITSGEIQVSDLVRGVVAAVRRNPAGQQDLVMLSVGKDEGVVAGMEFIVYRKNQFVAKVRAERVMTDMVACRVLHDTWNNQGHEIEMGDLAQNSLY